ncbi:MAG: chloride channel protein [Victivallales bacterium]
MKIISNIYNRLIGFINEVKKADFTFMIIFALIVGTATGLIAVYFIKAIFLLTDLFKGMAIERNWLYIFLPALGGLIIAPIFRFLAPEAKGHGVPDVILTVAAGRGLIRPIVVFAKSIGSIITISTGGSVGREGPIVQIGAGVGSTIAQFLKLNESKTITLLGCGAAAGLSATFNAPIAGVIFVTEVIMRRAGLREFSSVVVASVSSSVISRAMLGDDPAFHIDLPQLFQLKSNWELSLFLLLGIVSAVAGVMFIKTLLYTEETFEKTTKIPNILKPAFGGLIFGLLLFCLPQLYGPGFPVMEKVFNGDPSYVLPLLLVLVFAKIAGTSICIGSGSSGGVFAPALFIGAMTGGAFGKIAQDVCPNFVTEPKVYAIVGMAAVFGAAARAPVTAIIIIFEMTRNYQIILPLMFATVISVVIAEWLNKESIFTCQLAARGIDVRSSENKPILEMIRVEEAMLPIDKCLTVPACLPLRDLEARLHESHSRRSLVVDTQGKLFGIVTYQDLYNRPEILNSGTVADISTRKLLTVYPSDTLEDAMLILGGEDIQSLPVIEYSSTKKCLGVLRRRDLITAYSGALMKSEKRKQFIQKLKFKKATQTEFVEYTLKNEDSASGRKISEIKLPANCNIVTIFRNKDLIVPKGNTELKSGDLLVAVVENQDEFINALQFG